MSRSSGVKPTRKALFADTYRPVRLPWTYRPAAALVLLLALFQPLIYFATMGAVGWGVAVWAVSGLEIVGLGTGPSGGYRGGVYIMLWRLVAYATPLLAGVLVFLILLGSLAPSRSGPRVRAYPLARVEHPLIYAYVDKLSDIMGSPRPVRIELSPEANASASFDHDLLWLFRRRLVLTIGATLVAGLSRRELTGVIAHELGHFTQGVGMRSTRLIGGINVWFLRVVYKRGIVDDIVEDMRDSEWSVPVIMGSFVGLCVWLVRGFIKIMAAGSHLATAALLRRMEFAADRCGARVAGSAASVRSWARIEELSIGFARALEIAGHESGRMRLPDDLSGLAREIAPTLGRSGDGFIEGHRDEPSVWSTHPATSERVRALVALNERGIVLSDGPAVRLLPGFEQLSRHATRFTLERILGESLGAYRMMPVDEVLGRGEYAPVVSGPASSVACGPKGEVVRPAGNDDEGVIPLAD